MWPFNRREEKRSLTEWPWDTGDAPVSTTRELSQERALGLVPVFGAARLLADNIASLTPVLYRKGPGGRDERQPTPSLFNNPSIHGTVFDWLHRGVISMCLQGDAIGLITQRDFYGWPTMIEWFNPENVQTLDRAFSGPGSFTNPLWFWWGQQVDPKDLVHIPWFCLPWRVRGLSPLGAFRVVGHTGLGAQEYSAQWYENGGVPPGTLKNTTQKVLGTEADEITNRLVSRLRSRKPFVYGSDWEYTPIGIKPNEAQFIETARLTATQIAVIYGVPPEKIGGTTGETLTYSNVEQNSIDFLTFSLRPWLIRWESALTRCFPRGYYVKFETADLLRTDARTTAEIDQMSLGWQPPAWRSPDEIRADHGWKPLPKPAAPVVPAATSPATPSPAAPVGGPGTNGKPAPTPRLPNGAPLRRPTPAPTGL